MYSNENEYTFDVSRANLGIVFLAGVYLFWQQMSTLIAVLMPGIPLYWRLGLIQVIVLFVLCIAIPSSKIFRAIVLPLVWCGTVLFCGILSALVNSVTSILFVSYIYRILALGAVFTIFILLGTVSKNLRILIAFLIIISAVNSGVGVIGGVTGTSLLADTGDIAGTFGYDVKTGRAGGIRGENYVGVWSAPVLAYGLLRLFKKPYGLLGIVLTGCGGVAIVASLSRTSVLCGAAVFIACIIISVKRRIRVGNTILAIFALIFIAFVFKIAISTQLGHLTGRTLEEQIERWTTFDVSLSGRMYVWKQRLAGISGQPFLGHGPDSGLVRFGVVGHNVFLDLLYEFGLLGTICFVIPIVYIVVFSMRYFRLIVYDEYLGLLYIIAFGMLAAWLSLSAMYDKFIWIVIALLCGRIMYIKKQLYEGLLYGQYEMDMEAMSSDEALVSGEY